VWFALLSHISSTEHVFGLELRGKLMTFRNYLAGWLVLLAIVATSTTASASTTMVRLGYAKCSACHLDPKGAGLLTDYGKGIDVAQSLRVSEYEPPAEPPQFRYDLRLLTSAYATTESPAGARPAPPSWLRTYLRSSLALGAHNRLSSTVVMEAPPGDISRLWESKPVVDVLGAWEYRHSDGFTLAIARDRLPRGVEVGETRTVLQDTDSERYPAQVRAFIAKGVLHITAYAYGPGSQAALDRHSRGLGMLGELQLAGGHVVLGASARRALEQNLNGAPAFDRQTYGGFARVGYGKFGLLAEHEFTDRTVNPTQAGIPNRIAGYTQFFFVPKEWLVTSLIAEQTDDDSGARPRTLRWRPEVQLRFTSNITLTASARTDTTRPVVGGPSRIYLVQVAVKTVQ
jgi:hypothetical protein